MDSFKILTTSDYENLCLDKKREYLEKLREYTLKLKENKQVSFGQQIIKKVYPILRNYNILLYGEENIPKVDNVLFVVNHSSSHDIFTAYEFLGMLNRNGSVMVASDCLNSLTNTIFSISNSTMLDRRDKVSTNKAIYNMSKKMLNGLDGVIFGEATWNLHPVIPMQKIKMGSSKISSITSKKIVPTIMEYIECNDIVCKESDLYTKCIIYFGRPIEYKENISYIRQSELIRNEMIKMRLNIWRDYLINKDINDKKFQELYLNHTYVKKYKALGFEFNSLYESSFLLPLDNLNIINEFTTNKQGEFRPGITLKK
jgi:hypothetical protein